MLEVKGSIFYEFTDVERRVLGLSPGVETTSQGLATYAALKLLVEAWAPSALRTWVNGVRVTMEELEQQRYPDLLKLSSVGSTDGEDGEEVDEAERRGATELDRDTQCGWGLDCPANDRAESG